MPLRKITVSELQIGQIFLCPAGRMCRLLRPQHAELIRLPDGSEPSTETILRFELDDCVELVPGRNDSAQGDDSAECDDSSQGDDSAPEK